MLYSVNKYSGEFFSPHGQCEIGLHSGNPTDGYEAEMHDTE
jgi:hypothetical protein